MQGGQVGDQNSSRTTLPLNWANVIGSPSRSGPEMIGACKPGLRPLRVKPLVGPVEDSQPDKFSKPVAATAEPTNKAFLRFMIFFVNKYLVKMLG